MNVGLACQYDKMGVPMEIYLLRHGIAEAQAATDAERALTGEGKRKVHEVMNAALRAGVRPALVLSSPYRRAMETARIAAEILEYKGEIVRAQTLVPDADVHAVWEEIRVHRSEASILLVGHEPLFSSLGAFLLGVPELHIDFKKGALLALEMPAFGTRPHGILKWMLTAKLA
jgi:phosphohistidine phosphatase